MFSRFFIALRRYGFGNQRVLPSLDGLRAISICLVLVGHLIGTQGFAADIPGMNEIGLLGVRIFFVISGFLITGILVDELKRTGTVSLSRFYFRRTMRLFPASYFLIGCTAILAWWGLVHLDRGDVALGLTYTMNFRDHRGWPLGHLWSLAVEEQFYLLWPLTLRTLGCLRGRTFLVAVILIAPLLRLLSPMVAPVLNFVIWSDALATGCALALFREDLIANRYYARVLASPLFFLVPLTGYAVTQVPYVKISWLFCQTITNVCAAASVDWALRNPRSAVGRFLNVPAIAFVGVLSYSLYLWQQMFLNRTSDRPFCAFPLNICLAVGMALFSYLVIEAPFLKLRMALERSRTRQQRDPVACDVPKAAGAK